MSDNDKEQSEKQCDPADRLGAGGGFCVNCNNLHGCRSAPPPCEALQQTTELAQLSGKDAMRFRGLLAGCFACAHFRRCWQPGDWQNEMDGLLRD